MRHGFDKSVMAAIFALLFGALCPAAVNARSLETHEKASLATAVAEFSKAMSENNFEQLSLALPPRILASLGSTAQLPVEDVRKAMIDAMKTSFASVILDSFSMDVATAEYKELGSGAPYALIPTQTVVVVPGQGKMVEKTHSLALLDEGKWYLLRVSEAEQFVILKQVYPEFASVDFPQGSMEMLKK